jgi:RND family efflux transporter MFP subunit
MIKGVVVIASVIALLLSGCKDKASQGTVELKRQTISGLTTQVIAPSKVTDFYESTGTVKAKTVSVVSGRVMGVVKSVTVKEGDTVQKGQVLITIDDSDIAHKVQAAQKAVEVAKENRSLIDVTYKRYKNLHDQRAISGQEMDQIETQSKIAELEYQRAKAMLAEVQTLQGFTQIRAPESGVVTAKKVDVGHMAIPGAPFLVIESTGEYHVETHVDEGLLGQLKRGMEVEVSLEALGKTVRGTIKEIVPSVDPQSRTFLVKIAITGPNIKGGVFARVKVPIGAREALLVPEKAVVKRGQLSGVYVVDDKGLITYRLIRQGKRYGNAFEVITGLKTGERVVVEGADMAIDGALLVSEQRGVK